VNQISMPLAKMPKRATPTAAKSATTSQTLTPSGALPASESKYQPIRRPIAAPMSIASVNATATRASVTASSEGVQMNAKTRSAAAGRPRPLPVPGGRCRPRRDG